MGRDMGDTTLACSKKPACVGHEDERMSNYRASSPAPMSSREAAYALGRNGKGRVSPYDLDLQPEEFNAWVKGRNDRYSPLQVEQKRKSKVGKAFRDHGIEAFVASNFTAAGAAAGRPEPRLAANLVPASMWGKNVRAVVAEDTWHLLRSKFGATEVGPNSIGTDALAGEEPPTPKCAICGTRNTALQLHEEWLFDDSGRVQQLIGLWPLCTDCHLAKHLGYAERIGQLDRIMKHLALINSWTRDEAERHRN